MRENMRLKKQFLILTWICKCILRMNRRFKSQKKENLDLVMKNYDWVVSLILSFFLMQKKKVLGLQTLETNVDNTTKLWKKA